MTDASSSRAEASGNPPSRSSGSPASSSSPPGSRSANRRTTDSAGQAPGHEREHLGRGPIKPLDVIDQAEQRLLLRRVGEQAEHGQPDEKSIGLRARAQAERGRERVTLWRRQPPEPSSIPAQLMQAGERELHLPFHPSRAKDPTALGTLGGVIQ